MSGSDDLQKQLKDCVDNEGVDVHTFSSLCEAAIAANRSDLVEAALTNHLWFHKHSFHAIKVEVLRDTVAALAKQVAAGRTWYRTEAVALASTLFAIALEVQPIDEKAGRGYKLTFDKLCEAVVKAATGKELRSLDNDAASLTLLGVLASIISTGTLITVTADFAEWDSLGQGLTSTVTLLTGAASNVFKATSVPGSAIISAASSSAGQVVNSIINALLESISKETKTKTLVHNTLNTWINNLLLQLRLDSYGASTIKKTVADTSGTTPTAESDKKSGAGAAGSATNGTSPASTADEKHAVFNNNFTLAFLM